MLHDIPAIIDRLAGSFEASTMPIEAGSEVRVLVTSGRLVEFMAVYAVLVEDEAVEMIYLEIDGLGEVE